MCKVLKVEFINGDNKMNMKRDNVRIIRIILDLHGVTVDSRKVVLFEYVKPLLSCVVKDNTPLRIPFFGVNTCHRCQAREESARASHNWVWFYLSLVEKMERILPSNHRA